MRILHLLSQTELTGAEVYALNLAQWQKQNKHEVYLISDTLRPSSDLIYISRPIHPNSLWLRIKNIFWIRKFLREKEIQIIHCHSRAAARVAYWARMGLPVAFISTIHGRQHFSWSKRLFNLYGDKLIAICDKVRKHLINDFSISDSIIQVVGNPVFTPAMLAEPSAIENSHPPTYFDLGILGRTSGPKGLVTETLIEKVFPTLLQDYLGLRLHIVGGPIERLSKTAQKKLHELKIKYPNRIYHPGYVIALEDNIHRYDACVAAGRIAVASLCHQVPLFAIGEALNCGWVDLSTYENARASNFGDIADETQPIVQVHTDNLLNEIQSELKHLISGSSVILKQQKQLAERAKNDFSVEHVNQSIIDIYQWMYFKRLKPKNIPVLMYHMITQDKIQTSHKIYVTANRFQQHLELFSFWGMNTITCAELLDFVKGKRNINEYPSNPLILSFDDGYENNLSLAGPNLEKFKMKATLFLLANTSLKQNSWDQGQTPQMNLLNDNERKMVRKYFEIGSHGFSHQPITAFSNEDAQSELLNSKISLENELNIPIKTYAFTYGISEPIHHDFARMAGYDMVFNTDKGALHICDNPFSIFRTSVFPDDSNFSLWKKTRHWYRKYFYWKRGH